MKINGPAYCKISVNRIIYPCVFALVLSVSIYKYCFSAELISFINPVAPDDPSETDHTLYSCQNDHT